MKASTTGCSYDLWHGCYSLEMQVFCMLTKCYGNGQIAYFRLFGRGVRMV